MKFDLVIREDLITLDKTLKAVGAVDSGAHAREVITEGLVKVDGQVELRKTRKLYGGELVEFEDVQIQLKRHD